MCDKCEEARAEYGYASNVAWEEYMKAKEAALAEYELLRVLAWDNANKKQKAAHPPV